MAALAGPLPKRANSGGITSRFNTVLESNPPRMTAAMGAWIGDVPPEKAKEAMNRRNLWIGAAAAITLALLAAIALSMT